MRFLEHGEAPALTDTSYLTEEDLADFEDEQFIELATQARALAAETGTGLAAALIVGDVVDSLPEPETEGPTAFHYSRYAALLQKE